MLLSLDLGAFAHRCRRHSSKTRTWTCGLCGVRSDSLYKLETFPASSADDAYSYYAGKTVAWGNSIVRSEKGVCKFQPQGHRGYLCDEAKKHPRLRNPTMKRIKGNDFLWHLYRKLREYEWQLQLRMVCE